MTGSAARARAGARACPTDAREVTMSTIEQCPSTKKKGRPADPGATVRGRSAATGRAFWRSLDDLAESREFKDFLQREFPAHASELLSGSRRNFLKLMGASVALAGASTIPGCRRPERPLVAFNESPENSVPGKPLYYATALPGRAGGVEGLLAETYEGRPTKLEGNPLHPRNLGTSNARVQASILDLYDPDRAPLARGEGDGPAATPWDEFESEAGSVFGAFDATGGARLAFLVEKATSPSRDALRDRLLRRWRGARWFAYDASDDEGALAGAALAFGRPMRPEYRVENADVVVCLDRDLLGCEGGYEVDRGWGAGRYRPGPTAERSAAEARMNRLYVVESDMTLTGGQADHRLALKPSRVSAFAVALGRAVMSRLAQRGDLGAAGLASALERAEAAVAGEDLPIEWTDALAEDLIGDRGATMGRSLITAGRTQPAAVHALVHALNDALGNVGRTVSYREVEGDAAASSSASLAELTSLVEAGSIDTLVVIGGNPVRDAPPDSGFASAYRRVSESGRTVFLGAPNETAAASTTFLARSHPLESWGDARDWDGAYSVVQPMIRPLWDTRGELELLAIALGDEERDGYTIVRATLGARLGLPPTIPGSSGVPDPRFEERWRRCLHDGVLDGSPGTVPISAPTVRYPAIASAISEGASGFAPSDAIELVFKPCPKLGDGAAANNGWLQELPHPITKVTWDNPALISMRTAERLGLRTGRNLRGPTYNHVEVATVSLGGRSIDVPVWVQPGVPDDTVVLSLGYGREVCGRVGRGVGVAVEPLRPAGASPVARGATVERAGARPYMIASTQDHWSLEGRDVFREVDLHWWRLHGDEPIGGKDAYGNKRDPSQRGAQRMGMEGHTPVNRDVYNRKPSQRGARIFYYRHDGEGKPILTPDGRKQRPIFSTSKGGRSWEGKPVQQWGMSIDLTTCTGCGSCVVACQAENNIPIVGKKEVAKGREMHWIRVDRYYASDTVDERAFAEPDMVVQPVTCMHCESAPCEVVCPVNATVHSRRGTNDMTYNRCIGTRYCSNNCPYKVRRFNYFDYATKRFNGNFSGKSALPEALRPSNENLVPPRLREKVTEVESMRNNPHVTVRSRGVMEKCTYCIQRINAASVETKLSDLDHIPDGFFKVACEAACPSGSIVFGDIYDNDAAEGAGSRVQRAKRDPRTFAMLDYLNIGPRTTYMLRVRNPNERLRPRGENPFDHHGHDDHGHGEEEKEDGHVMSLPLLNDAAGVGAPA